MEIVVLYNSAAVSSHTKKLCSRLHSIEATYIFFKNEKIAFEPPFWDLGVTYALHLWLVGKPVVDFIFIIIELFSLSPTVETVQVEIGRSGRFLKGMGHFECRFQREGGVAHQPLLVPK